MITLVVSCPPVFVDAVTVWLSNKLVLGAAIGVGVGVSIGVVPLKLVAVCVGVKKTAVWLRLSNCRLACASSVALTDVVVTVVTWEEVRVVV